MKNKNTDMSNRGVQVGGNVSDSVLVAGDGNTITMHLEKVTLPPADSVNIREEINSLKAALAQLQSNQQMKINNAVSEVEHELAQPAPDKDEIGSTLDRALKVAQKTEGYIRTIDKLKPRITNIAAWLGENGYKLLAAVGLTT